MGGLRESVSTFGCADAQLQWAIVGPKSGGHVHGGFTLLDLFLALQAKTKFYDILWHMTLFAARSPARYARQGKKGKGKGPPHSGKAGLAHTDATILVLKHRAFLQED